MEKIQVSRSIHIFQTKSMVRPLKCFCGTFYQPKNGNNLLLLSHSIFFSSISYNFAFYPWGIESFLKMNNKPDECDWSVEKYQFKWNEVHNKAIKWHNVKLLYIFFKDCYYRNGKREMLEWWLHLWQTQWWKYKWFEIDFQ